jgi:VanZ family protein
MALIFGISGLSNPAPLMPSGFSDKGGHFVGYVLLSVLLLRALAGGRISGITWRAALLAILLATLYGISDEVHQSFVPGRTPDLHDVMADALGGCMGAALGGFLRLVAGDRKSGPAASA